MKIASHLRWSITEEPLPDPILDVLADLHWGREESELQPLLGTADQPQAAPPISTDAVPSPN